mgnify:CR=1 FL=1
MQGRKDDLVERRVGGQSKEELFSPSAARCLYGLAGACDTATGDRYRRPINTISYVIVELAKVGTKGGDGIGETNAEDVGVAFNYGDIDQRYVAGRVDVIRRIGTTRRQCERYCLNHVKSAIRCRVPFGKQGQIADNDRIDIEVRVVADRLKILCRQ